MNITLTILGMAVITFLVKALIFILGDRVAFSGNLKKALEFVPVTVLTAIIIPMILSPHGKELELSWRNPQLVAATVAALLCAVTRHQLATIIVGLTVFFSWQFMLS
ncbi:MAG: AzlD domain-containing protein [Pseudomonadota bacterium]